MTVTLEEGSPAACHHTTFQPFDSPHASWSDEQSHTQCLHLATHLSSLSTLTSDDILDTQLQHVLQQYDSNTPGRYYLFVLPDSALLTGSSSALAQVAVLGQYRHAWVQYSATAGKGSTSGSSNLKDRMMAAVGPVLARAFTAKSGQ